MELQALPSRIGQVRRIVSAQLRYWHLDPLIDRAALGVTELLTNVHLHAQPDKMCTVEIELLLDRLTVSVHDHDPRLPRVREMRRRGHRAGAGSPWSPRSARAGACGRTASGQGRVVHPADARRRAAAGAASSRRTTRPASRPSGTPRSSAVDGRRPEQRSARSAVAG